MNESSEFKFTKNSRTIVNLTVINVANYWWSSYGREQQAKISFSHPSKVPINIHNYGGGRDIPVGWLTVKDSLGMSRTAPIIPRSPVFNYSNFKLKPRAIKPGQNTVMEGEVKLVGNNTLDDSIKMETELSTDGQKEWNKSFKIHPGDTKKISVDISKNKAGVYKLGLFTTSIGVGVGSHKFVRDLLVYPSGTSSSSSDSSSSGTVSGGVSAITSNEDPENYNGVVTKYLWGINAGDTVTQPLETYNLVVKRVSFNYGVAANEVKVRVEELKGPTTTLDKAPPGKIYKNFNLYVSVPDKTKMTNPALTLDVNKKWLKENNYEPNNLQLARWNNSKEKWKLHPLKVENVTKDAYSLRTTQLPGFSQYAITVVEKEESAAKETATPTHTPTPTETPAATAKSPEENVPGLTSPAAIVALVLGVLAALAREKG
ncbi:MAG: hypothetical protein MAG715_00496 [Methanonatronarchaeales archaeon]|nr:hypothetical protein [Methanonatronarchaeales archaeon]